MSSSVPFPKVSHLLRLGTHALNRMPKGGTDLSPATHSIPTQLQLLPSPEQQSLAATQDFSLTPSTFRPETRGGRSGAMVAGTRPDLPRPQQHPGSPSPPRTQHMRCLLPPPTLPPRRREPVNTPARPRSPRQARRRLPPPRTARPSSESAEGSLGHTAPSPPPPPPSPRLGEVAPRRLLPAAPELGQAARPPGPSPARPAAPASPAARAPGWLAGSPARPPAGLRRPEFTSEAPPRAAGSARRARPPARQRRHIPAAGGGRRR